jgi:hypothetical protein
MSLQFSILKVLAGQVNGRATVADINRYITLLSGPEWSARMKRLSALAPDLDIFGSGFVQRDDAGWQLTKAGYAFLAALETPVRANYGAELATPDVIVIAPAAVRERSEPPRLVSSNPPARRRVLGKRHFAHRSAVA